MQELETRDNSFANVCRAEDQAAVRRPGKGYLAAKRCFDVVMSFLALILLSPLFLIIAIVIQADSPGKIIYGHHRIGKNGKPLRMYKFRSMVTDADKLIERFTPEQKREYEQNYKLENDPRITRVGKFLRATSLDELPQLVNVLKGELSLVGPRPVVEDELAKYGENADKFLSVTPGVTGYWQANGRSDTTYEQRMEMELYYVDPVSYTHLDVYKRQAHWYTAVSKKKISALIPNFPK